MSMEPGQDQNSGQPMSLPEESVSHIQGGQEEWSTWEEEPRGAIPKQRKPPASKKGVVTRRKAGKGSQPESYPKAPTVAPAWRESAAGLSPAVRKDGKEVRMEQRMDAVQDEMKELKTALTRIVLALERNPVQQSWGPLDDDDEEEETEQRDYDLRPRPRSRDRPPQPPPSTRQPSPAPQMPRPPTRGLRRRAGPGSDSEEEEEERRKTKVLDMKLQYDGDPEKLPMFLVHVMNFMDDYGPVFRNDRHKVNTVAKCLTGPPSKWFVGLHDRREPCLWDFDQFMDTFRQRFEDPFRRNKARQRLHTLKQGSLTVTEFAEEFRRIATDLPDWSEITFLEYFKKGLRPVLLREGLRRADPPDMEGWVALAEEIEDTLRQWQIYGPQGERTSKFKPKAVSPTAKETPRPQERERQPFSREGGRCFNCNEFGHRAAQCPARRPQSKPPMTPRPEDSPTKGKPAMRRSTSTAKTALLSLSPAEEETSETSEEEGQETTPIPSPAENFSSLS